MATNFTVAVNNSRASALITAAGTGSKIKIYSGAAPTNADTSPAGTLLATLVISGVLGTAASGVITLGTVTTATAAATGTAGFARLTTSADVTLCDLTVVGTSGSDVNLNNTSITSGGTVSVSSGTITEAYP